MNTIPTELVPRILALAEFMWDFWPKHPLVLPVLREPFDEYDVGAQEIVYDALCMACIRTLQREKFNPGFCYESNTVGLAGDIGLAGMFGSGIGIPVYCTDLLTNLISAVEWAKGRKENT